MKPLNHPKPPTGGGPVGLDPPGLKRDGLLAQEFKDFGVSLPKSKKSLFRHVVFVRTMICETRFFSRCIFLKSGRSGGALNRPSLLLGRKRRLGECSGALGFGFQKDDGGASFLRSLMGFLT